ncbi:MAG: S-methyl-5-thioribose-1-phosphate isomerase [Nitrososphaerota archaeon]|nr:S-methyl-5-thioribose-1-phosphate isomerase [Candidatus Calditenuaceae archaeon]MDW8072687.1 S-methyl-5-thioribose-1-phosphate isomerase [Nitrososphaerota archaeon]
MRELKTLFWRNGNLYLLDQRLLPHRERYFRCRSYRDVAWAIKEMVVRGAPAIGVAAAYGMVLACKSSRWSGRSFEAKLRKAAETIKSTRPTAVNLFWAVDRMLKVAEKAISGGEDVYRRLLEEANGILQADIETNRRIGEFGKGLIPDRSTVMTYCNAGGLATAGYGTALGVIRAAYDGGKNISVLVPETRPKLQGARLTAYELKKLGIPYRIITDNMAAMLMSQGYVSCVVVGADRILAKTGHVINKIGTLGLAIAASYYGIPFYVAAPLSSIDFKSSPQEVKIEERDASEVTTIAGRSIAPRGSHAVNLAFDITPPGLVSAVITEHGVYEPVGLMALERYIRGELG